MQVFQDQVEAFCEFAQIIIHLDRNSLGQIAFSLGDIVQLIPEGTNRCDNHFQEYSEEPNTDQYGDDCDQKDGHRAALAFRRGFTGSNLGLRIGVSANLIKVIAEIIEKLVGLTGCQRSCLLGISRLCQLKNSLGGTQPTLVGRIKPSGNIGYTSAFKPGHRLVKAFESLSSIFIETGEVVLTLLIVELGVHKGHLGHHCLVEIPVTVEDFADGWQVGFGNVVGVGDQIPDGTDSE